MEDRSLMFGDCAELIRKAVHPEDVQNVRYVGLEHIGQETLHLNGFGEAQETISNKTIFSKGDILFGKLRPYFRKVVRATFDGVCSTDIWVVRAKKGIDQGFLYYWMASNDFIDFSTRGSEGTRMPRAKWEHVSRHRIQFADIKRQRTIARILGSLDEKIDINRRMSKTLETIAGTLFKSWFVNFDPVVDNALMIGSFIPKELRPYATRRKKLIHDGGLSLGKVHNLFPSEFEMTGELGWVPKGWRVCSLDQIAAYMNGLACQKYPTKNDEDGLPVIKIRELRGGIDRRTEKATESVPSKYIVKDGDILFSWSGSLLVKAWTGGDGVLNQHIFKVTSREYPKWFVYFWTCQHLKEFIQIANDKATTMGHIKRDHLQSVKVIVPDDTILERLGNCIAGPFDKAVKNLCQSVSLRQLRDSMLPKLLSGELSVKDKAVLSGKCE